MAGASTREVAIRHSLVRLKLLAGGERQATIMNFAVAFLIMMITRDLLGILAAVAIAAVIQSILVLLAKWDPQAIAVVSRNMKYQHFYGNAATLDAEPGLAHVTEKAPLAMLLGFTKKNKGGKNAKH